MYHIKQKPEDFIVKEIPDYESDENGNYAYFWLTKKNFTTVEAIRRIANKLDILLKRIGFAGSKDKIALTKQVISIKDIKKELDEKDEYRFLNHVVLQDKYGKKNLNNLGKEQKHNIQTKQEQYNERRSRTLQHYQSQKVKEREEMEDIKNRIAKREEKERRAKEEKMTKIKT